ARRAGSLPTFARGSHYCINILAADQMALAQRFATRDIDRFAGVPWAEGAGGAPVLAGAVATFECHSRHRYYGGDHIIMIGVVERYGYDAERAPLVFHRGRYAQL
ncbi:MAG: flavin reductase family protein, partial [Betaproteobacteria bacterium]|nr:flavin reductase family protein [Betaproteobacteria bacterium]